MQSLRFESRGIFVLEKSVQLCGKNVAKSKKRVKWVIKQELQIHEVYCEASFLSGKKRVIHNGLCVLETTNPKKYLDFILAIGAHRLILTMDEMGEEAKLELKYEDQHDEFSRFANVYSEENCQVYEKAFS